MDSGFGWQYTDSHSIIKELAILSAIIPLRTPGVFHVAEKFVRRCMGVSASHPMAPLRCDSTSSASDQAGPASKGWDLHVLDKITLNMFTISELQLCVTKTY